jgi:hypothetical protein
MFCDLDASRIGIATGLVVVGDLIGSGEAHPRREAVPASEFRPGKKQASLSGWKQRQRAGLRRAVLQYRDRPPPRQFLRVVDLAEV